MAYWPTHWMYIYVCLYVCIYNVCMCVYLPYGLLAYLLHVCMYVCIMYVCMYIYRMALWPTHCIYVCMYVSTVCNMYECMYVCIFTVWLITFTLTACLNVCIYVCVLHRLLGATDSMESLLKEAEGPSTLNPATEREGLVFRANLDRRVNFKCISNKFLLKYDE
jgi:hypothetical protein